jgi:cell division protein FtsB
MRVSLKHGLVAVLTGLVLVGLLAVGIFGDKGLVDLGQLRGELHRLNGEVERLKAENLALYRHIDRLRNDAAFVENVARQELGMIAKDELIINFRQPEGTNSNK